MPVSDDGTLLPERQTMDESLLACRERVHILDGVEVKIPTSSVVLLNLLRMLLRSNQHQEALVNSNSNTRRRGRSRRLQGWTSRTWNGPRPGAAHTSLFITHSNRSPDAPKALRHAEDEGVACYLRHVTSLLPEVRLPSYMTSGRPLCV